LTEAVPLAKEAVRDLARTVLESVELTPAEEMAYGATLYGELRKNLGRKLDANARDVAYVRAVGRRVAEHRSRRGIAHTFHVVEDPAVNAYAIAGGHVFVFRGLLQRTVENEAQLAAVLGHEIAHIDAGHTSDFLKPIKVASSLPFANVSVLVTSLATRVVLVTFNEIQEAEADEIGLKLAFRGGYDPREAALLHRRVASMAAAGSADPLVELVQALARTHPPSEARAGALDRQATELMQATPKRRVHVGKKNYANRIPITQRIYD
jgi:predicted Zn-dependent protease